MDRRHFLYDLSTAGILTLFAPISIGAAAAAQTMSAFAAPEAGNQDLDWFDDLFPDAVPGTRAALEAIAIPRADLTRHRRLVYFVAQCAHECAGFSALLETCDGTRYEGRRNLGNTRHGDGRRYRGRGWLQITGRHNYERLERDTGLHVAECPDLLEHPDQAAIAAAWYWRHIGGNRYADRGDFRGLTYAINGGYTGYHDRMRWLRRIDDVAG